MKPVVKVRDWVTGICLVQLASATGVDSLRHSPEHVNVRGTRVVVDAIDHGNGDANAEMQPRGQVQADGKRHPL